jgi:CBS domain-containing protein
MNKCECVHDRPLVLGATVAADLMTPNPVSIGESARVREAAAFLIHHGISAAPVIDDSGRPVGVLSQSDLVAHDREKANYVLTAEEGDDYLAEPGAGEATSICRAGRRLETIEDPACVRDLMTPTVFTVARDAPVARVIVDLLALRVHRLFVVDDAGVLVGVVSALDVLRRLHAPRPNGGEIPG